ncbi:general substrate transporter [Purpureocillium lavendulum]|uniref:General substrate transporter n=1 Tax=Purpureocillium lavendulum TaxID=1247861 RepID=A0AB34G457_9HYPO|nr:general substrate transporter [Purpureocillium lavendulum]
MTSNSSSTAQGLTARAAADVTPPQNGDQRDAEKQTVQSQNLEPARYSVFTTWQKRAMVLGASLTAFFSPLTAQIYLPALTAIAKDFEVTSSQINLTITTYMVFQGVTPMFIGSLADSGGRRPAYIVCFVIYIAANIGLALAPSYNALLGLRCLQSAGSSTTVALCTAVVADVVTSAERGQYIGFTVVPAVLAPALGPVIGGLLSQYLGWRSIFWFLVITSGATVVVLAVFLPETCRHIVGDGSIPPPPMYRSLWQTLTRRRRRSRETQDCETASVATTANKFKFKPPNILGSLFMLFEKQTSLLLWTSSVVFAGFYCIATAMPSLFADRYGYDQIKVGLMYLPLAGGSVAAAVVVGPVINWNYKRHCIRLGIPYDRSRQQDLSNFPIERVRLEIGFPLLALGGTSLIAWGWAMHAVTHVAVLCVIAVFVGIGMIGYSNATNILLIDIHPGKAGTATAANNLTRCLVGAGATAAVVPMINAMGVGGAFSLIGGLYFVCFLPLLAILRWGMAWREEVRIKAERKRQRREANLEVTTD